MICRNCKTREVPAEGRAAQHGLCCKCDRLLNGPQTKEDKAPKQLRRVAQRLGVAPSHLADFPGMQET